MLVLRLIVGATFLYAAYDKVLHPDQFAVAVRTYQILPVSLTNLFALVLAWAELVAGLLLIAGVFTRQAAGAVLMMLFMFIVALSVVMFRGMVIDCGCFSTEGGTQVDTLLIVRNVLLMAACVLIMRFDRGALSLPRLFAPATR